jgi:Zn-dependent protease
MHSARALDRAPTRRVRWRGSSPPFGRSISARTKPRAIDVPQESDIRPARILRHPLFAGGMALSAVIAAASFVTETSAVSMILSITLLVICLGIHEAAHAWVAWKCGDPTGKDLGRITLNPIPHIDPVMTIIVPGIVYATTGFLFGGAKPVPVNFHRLRHPYRDMSLVALAGPGSNFLLALFFVVAWKFFVTTGYYNDAGASVYTRQDDLLPQVLKGAVRFNLLLTVFNLVPIPPLDGSRVMAWLLPPGLREPYGALERYGLLIVFGLVFFSPGFNHFVMSTMNTLFYALDKVTSFGGL